MPPAASTAITERISRVRRAGNTFTVISVTALPTTAGMTNIGSITASATSGNSRPPLYTMPYAVNIGMETSTTIQLDATIVSSSLAP